MYKLAGFVADKIDLLAIRLFNDSLNDFFLEFNIIIDQFNEIITVFDFSCKKPVSWLARLHSWMVYQHSEIFPLRGDLHDCGLGKGIVDIFKHRSTGGKYSYIRFHQLGKCP